MSTLRGYQFVRISSLVMTLGLITGSASAQDNDVFDPYENDSKPQPDNSQPVTPAPSDLPSTTSRKQGTAIIPMTCYANMENGHHILDRGYRFILKNGGSIIAAGPMRINAAVKGKMMDGAGKFGNTRVALEVDLEYVSGSVQSGGMDGQRSGTASICMAANPQAPMESSSCKRLASAVDNSETGEYARLWQLIDRQVSYTVDAGTIRIQNWSGFVGTEGSAQAPAASCFHPAYSAFAPKKAFKDYQSPLVLDMDRDGKVELTDVWDDTTKVHFDVEGDGNVSRTGWVHPDDALLAIDRNGDGMINDGRELFSEYSWGYELEQRVRRRFDNGFQALAQYDHNKDGVVDAKDPGYKYMVLWHDVNQDGVSQASEMTKLPESTVVSLSLRYNKTSHSGNYPTIAGNEVRYEATYRHKDGKDYDVADVWFRQRRQPHVTLQSIKPSK